MRQSSASFKKGKAEIQIEEIGFKKWAVRFRVDPTYHYTTFLSNVAYSKAIKRFNECSKIMMEGKTNFS